jgi:cell wall-associated NlpC family hydrolase
MPLGLIREITAFRVRDDPAPIKGKHMDRESIDSSQSITSIIHDGETRVIRSHRRPRVQRFRISRVVGVAMVAALAVSSAASAPPAQSTTAVVEASAFPALPDRGSAVDRSARLAPTRSQKIEKVIAYAMAQRGDLYRWGATGPNRWDCSGLVSVAFRKGANKSLPHFTGGIQRKGSRVSKANLKRGDIIFPQRGHVGIYLGNGRMIAASSGKGRVIVQRVYGFYTARRVI